MDDDDYGSRSFMGPMYMLSMMTPVLMIMAITSLLFPLILYVVARWRDNKAPVADPQLGLKFALHFFRVQSYQILLMGAAMFLYALLSKELKGEAREESAKAGERTKGAFEEVTGAIKNRVGAVIDNEQMQAEGKAKELEGEARQKINR